MTDQQAQGLWTLLLAAYPTQVLEGPTQALYLAHLRALPWRDGRTDADLRALIATRLEAFMPALGAVVAAIGIHDVTHRDGTNGARQLAEAVRTGRELVPDLGTASGWAIGAPVRAVPSLGRDDLGRDGRVLPAPRPEDAFTEDQRRENLARLGSLARTLGRGPGPTPAPTRPARTPRPAPDPAVVEAELQAFEARWQAQGRTQR